MFNLPKDLIKIINQSQRMVVFTGAGISAESGIPTFREAQTGLWAKYDPMQLATPQAFAKNPELVWQWYAWRRKLVQAAQPNAAHLALVDLEASLPDFVLVTQNVDGLHQRAGSKNVIELHGNINRIKCFFDASHVIAEQCYDDNLPSCPVCSANLRPDVVWFGESLPEEALRQAFNAAENCDLCLSIGTSALIYPAAGIPLAAKQAGARVVEINLSPTALSEHTDFTLFGTAAQILPYISATFSS